ncbi:hypothetical protein KRX56_06040 [Dermabacteraceae bacterium TAE3-ERU27]|nr:hypothetical protein [Dermabacteraceae bacterium TAE3-ERU27]
MADRTLFTGHRVEAYRWLLLDRDDNLVRELDRVEAGQVELNTNTRLRAGGSLTVAEELPWMDHRVQPWVSVNGQEWPLGVFVFASPKETHQDGAVKYEVELLGKLAVVDGNNLPYTFTAPKDVLVTDVITQALNAGGVYSLEITPSPLRTSNVMVWEAGTSLLNIVNDLLASINYFSLDVDGYGVFKAAPYRPPAQRSIAWDFQPGAASIHSPQWGVDRDIAAVPNRAVLVSQGGGEEPALVGVAENHDVASPFSFEARGRWITLHESGVEAADQATITALAERRLLAASSPSATLDVQHAVVPVGLNDVVRFRDRSAVVEKFSLQTHPGALVSATWREVAA